MAHTLTDRKKISSRLARLRGQIDAVSRAVDGDEDCYQVMQLLASCRGALNGLMGELIENHIREHVVEAENRKLASESGEDLIEIMRSFWK